VFPPGTLIASRYRVIREIGRGGMGAVYLVEHVHTGARHALKALHSHLSSSGNAVERFRREARVASLIQSDHIATISDADASGGDQGVPFLVMELLNGVDVEQLVRERQRLPPQLVVAILKQAARALERAHAAGIVHRDLKPENLFYHHPPDGAPLIKVLDFGISKAVGAGETGNDPALTGVGGIVGTPLYMAPEQAVGGPVSPQTDIWAIGMIAFRLLAGEPYWQGADRPSVIASLMAGLPSMPSLRAVHIPMGFDAWFSRSCAHEPAQRFESVAQQAAALAPALGVMDPSGLLDSVSHARVDARQPTPSPYAPTTVGSSNVTPAPVAMVPAVVHRARSGTASSGVSWIWLAAGLLGLMLVAGGIAAIAVGAMTAASAARSDDADEPTTAPIPSGAPYVITTRILGGPPALNQAQIRIAAESRFGDLIGCYQQALEREPGLAGKLTLMMTIDAAGRVRTSMPAIGGVPDEALRSCCVAMSTAWQFPAPSASIASFQYTVELGRKR
jgi:serine/threonine protein kinase